MIKSAYNLTTVRKKEPITIFSSEGVEGKANFWGSPSNQAGTGNSSHLKSYHYIVIRPLLSSKLKRGIENHLSVVQVIMQWGNFAKTNRQRDALVAHE